MLNRSELSMKRSFIYNKIVHKYSLCFYSRSTHVSNDSNQIPTDSIQENVGEKEKEAPALFFTNVDKPKETKSDRTVSINIKETDTFVLMNVVAVCVSNEDENIAKVKENNAKYLEVSFFILL